MKKRISRQEDNKVLSEIQKLHEEIFQLRNEIMSLRIELMNLRTITIVQTPPITTPPMPNITDPWVVVCNTQSKLTD